MLIKFYIIHYCQQSIKIYVINLYTQSELRKGEIATVCVFDEKKKFKSQKDVNRSFSDITFLEILMAFFFF